MSIPTDPFVNPTALIPRVKIEMLVGDSAGPIALPGITMQDIILRVWYPASAGVVASGENSAVVTGWAGNNHVVDAAEDTAGEVTIDTGLTAPDAITVMVLRAGVDIHADLTITITGSDIVIADGAADDILENDVIHWTAFDASDAVLVPVFTGDAGGAGSLATDLTSEFTISDDDEIDNTGGTDTTGGLLFVMWYDRDFGETVNADWV